MSKTRLMRGRLSLLATSLLLAATPVAAAPSPAKPPVPVVVAVLMESGANLLHEEFQVGASGAVLPAGAPRARTVPLPGPGPFQDRVAAAKAGPLGSTPPGELLHVQGTNVLVYNAESTPRDAFFSPAHGTYVLSSVLGRRLGVSPDVRVVFVLGSSTSAWAWAAEQPWIDVVSTSYYFVSGGDSHGSAAGRVACPGAGAVRQVASRKLVFAAGGNGTPESHGTAPAGLPEVIRVGGHVESPHRELLITRPYEFSDNFEVEAARGDADSGSLTVAGTSFTAPRAAARAAQLIAQARRLLVDRAGGIREGKVAVAGAGVRLPVRGPLADGSLTAGEIRQLMQDTATPVAADASMRYPVEGFGRLDEEQMRLARAVLDGSRPAPERATERGQHDLLQQARGLVTGAPRCDRA